MNRTGRIVITLAALTLAVTLCACGRQEIPSDRYFTGESQDWTARVCMVNQGVTDIVLVPNPKLDYSDRIYVQLKGKAEAGQGDYAQIREGGTYSVKLDTDSELFNHPDGLTITVEYGEASETVPLEQMQKNESLSSAQ